MRIRSKQRSGCDVDMSAFSDIAFLLIIFFILTTTFNRQQGTLLNIPSGTQDDTLAQEENPTVNLSPAHIVFRNRETTLEDFRDALREMRLAELPEDDRIIVLECTDDVAFERYFQVVAAITDAGGVLAVMEKDEEGATR